MSVQKAGMNGPGSRSEIVGRQPKSLVSTGPGGTGDRRDEKETTTNKEVQMIGKYCIVRTYSAGVFAGILISREGKEVVMRDARRIWYWSGAASLSQLAVDGTSDPKNCKFPVPVPEITLTESIEIIPTTEKAEKSIREVPIWKK